MLKRHSKVLIRCLTVLLLFFLLDLCGVFTHFLEKDFEKYFYYPVNSLGRWQYNNNNENNNVNLPTTYISNEAFNYSFILQPKIASAATMRPRLTILIKSATGNSERRKAIRQTWGYENRFSDVHIRRVFMLGLPSSDDSNQMDRITQESVQYNDIVQSDFHDAYFNNTIKTMMSLRWANERFNNSDYYMFVDDDYYVSVKNVLRFLGRNGHNKQPKNDGSVLLFAGYVFQSAPLRHKFSKWYVSLQEYPFDKWPPYVTAGSFIMSRAALLQMYTTSRTLPLFRFDDVYLGIVALKANIRVQHCDNFYFNRPRYKGPDSYSNVIATHGFDDPVDMERIWNECRSSNYA